MTLYTIIVKKEALADVAVAYEYYEIKQKGLGERFLQALLKRYNDIALHPEHYSYITEDSLKIFRSVRLEKFPYFIIYEIEENNVIVYAVHNAYLHPDKKIRK